MQLPVGTPFTRVGAQAAGIGPRQLSALIRNGSVTRPFRGAYVLGDLANDLASRASAVAVVLPEGAVLCRGTAAWLLGIGDVRGPGRVSGPADVECVVPLGATPVRRPGVQCYQAPLEPRDVVLVGGLMCTTPQRTAVDLARWLPRPMGLAALDALAHRELIDLDRVRRELERFAGCSGVEVARQLVAIAEPATESFGESWLRLRVIDAGFPHPQAQVWIYDSRGRPVYRLDLGLIAEQKGFEYDGDEHHGSPENIARDDARRDRLRLEFGWTVVGFHRGHVLGRHLYVENTIGELLGQAPTISRRSW